MKKIIGLMVSILTISLFSLSSFAADQYMTSDQSSPSNDQSMTKMEKVEKIKGKLSVDQRIAMHEDLIKIHQAAIDCLKSNSPQMQCMKDFKNSMQDLHKKYFPNAKMKHGCHEMM